MVVRLTDLDLFVECRLLFRISRLLDIIHTWYSNVSEATLFPKCCFVFRVLGKGQTLETESSSSVIN
jgi:hypothetical protein